MLIDKDWDFETAIREISKRYYPGGQTTGPLRNRQVEAWGQIVGKTRALAEFDDAIKRYGSRTAFGREYRVTPRTLQSFREFFENLPGDQGDEKKSSKITRAFISYSWDNNDHKKWIRKLAIRLRGDGIDVTLDQWHIVPGDQLPEFMERSVRDSDFVLIVCTKKYKERSDNREGGVGYEGDIITAEFMATRNHRKFIPILRQQPWKESAPNWLLGKYYIDLSLSPYQQDHYDDLLTTLLGTREAAPPVGALTKIGRHPLAENEGQKTEIPTSVEPIQITGIIANQVGVPTNDGTRGSALYRIPFRLTQRPSREWVDLFVKNWNHPPKFTTMHRPGIATVIGDTIVLDGTTIEEVRDYHRDTLVLAIQKTNEDFKEFSERRARTIQQKQDLLTAHRKTIDDISSEIEFNDD
ncbi:MAG: TIR domain-containing protein [Anaerolineae bacterium]|nr:MAG: TIR domain-containing protein [Anaerolineae bacterium]